MTSIIKVNNLQNQCGANIINENAGTITIGASGDTITLACGASQTGFGRTGTVSWDTTPKTTGFTAVSGNGYFCDTTSAAFTVTLPATPSAGDIVAIADYANTAATNNITVGRNSSPIDGETEDAKIKINGQVYTLVYVDATEGWKTVGQTFNQINTAEFVAATGGTVTESGDYKIHSFTGPGTFTVTNVGTPTGSNTVDYLVIAGGGSGGTRYGGGGGAGGYRESSGAASGCYTASPLGACVSALPVSASSYPITVGGGGSGVSCNNTPATTTLPGNRGSNSVFSTITSTGGGGGIGQDKTAPTSPPSPGGSGGGGSYNPSFGAGNTPPVSPPQGNNGGTGIGDPNYSVGGGGGAGAAGGNGSPTTSGAGGNGVSSSITASSVTRAGGGGGGGSLNHPISAAPGGTGGGTAGGSSPGSTTTAGTANTGGGSGGAYGYPGSSGNGGSGIVIIRYKFQ
jgi:hypothetical protein